MPFAAAPATVDRHRHAWLALRGSLADGTRYRLSVSETIDRKEKPKRKKNKVKLRTRGSVELQLRPRAGKYGDSAAIVEALRGTPPKAPLQLTKLGAAGTRIVARFATGQHVKITARRGTSEQGEAHLVRADVLLQALLWAWDGMGRTARSA